MGVLVHALVFLQLSVGGLTLLTEVSRLCNLDHFPLVQTVKSSTSSTLVSVWMTVLTGTLPASSSRSVCAATLTAPCAAAPVLTTARCVATREPSVTTESACLSAAAAPTTTRPPTSAEVGAGWSSVGADFKGAKGMKGNSDLSGFSRL